MCRFTIVAVLMGSVAACNQHNNAPQAEPKRVNVDNVRETPPAKQVDVQAPGVRVKVNPE